MNPLVLGILLSFAPVSELRGGIPFMVANGISLKLAFLVGVVANLAVIPLLFIFLDHLHGSLLKLNFYRKGFNAFLKRLRLKERSLQRKWHNLGFIALTLFVCIPLPSTGAWTGTFLAWLFDLNRAKAITAIALGVLLAGIIVSLAVLGILKILR